MSTIEPPSLGRYLVGCVIMLAAVVAPLALAWLRTTNRGQSYTRGLGCVSRDVACSGMAGAACLCQATPPTRLPRLPAPLR